MGCWNHTCAITNLPIFAGEDVEVILLQRSCNIDDASFCNPTEYHSPLPLTFSGKYDDYGSVEMCESSVALDIIVNRLKEVLFEMEEGENQYHDIPAKRDEFDVDKLFELDHEQRLYMHTNGKMQHDMREKYRIKHIVVRKEVYDGIINGMTFDRWDRENSKMVEYKFSDLEADYEQYTKDIDAIIDEDKDLINIFWMMEGKIGETKIGEMLAYRGSGGYQMRYPIDVVDTLVKLRQAKNDDFDAVLDNAMRLRAVVSFMDIGRKSWHVPSGVGSQDQETRCQELCATLTLSAAKTVNKYYSEEE